MTLTTEMMHEIYEAAVHSEASGSESAEFELLCKLESVGGTSATIRKLIDMVRAANREAKPFGYVYTSKDGVAVNFGYELPFMPEKWNVTPVYTAPPAPAVPEEMTGGIAMNKYKVKKSNYAQWVKGWNACRAAMLAQPVSGGYKLPPHVYRELVNSLRDTAVKYQGTQQLREQLSRTLMKNGLSAAAPESGNDHDTRR